MPVTGPPAGGEDGFPYTVIKNIAYITFDFQETIATNLRNPHDPSQGTDPDKEAFVTIWPNPELDKAEHKKYTEEP